MDNDRVLELLEAADWNNIIIQLTYYAVFCFKRYSWKSDFPKGYSPDDIAISAIEKVWDGTREWDPDKYPDLLKHLEWIVKSDVEHLFSSLEHRSTGRTPVLINEDGTEVELEKTNCEYEHSITPKVPTPEEELIAKEEQEYKDRFLAELHKSVIGDKDLEFLLLCFEDGIDKPIEIAAISEWDINKIYTLKRKLLRKAAKIGKEILKMKEEL